jgi:hypothetical protein
MPNGTKLSQKLPWNYPVYLFGVVILVLGRFPDLISAYYLPYCFKPLSLLLRTISGKFEITLGEGLYLLFIISLIINLIQNLWRNRTQLTIPRFWLFQCVGVLNGLVKLYILFQLCWGFNYQKYSPAADFKLKVPKGYTEAQMDSLSLDLIDQLNQSRALLTDSQLKGLKFEEVATQTIAQYDQAELEYPFLQYRRSVIKEAIFPNWGDYFGYTAFYQPLTGEAIVRGDLPLLTQPFTISHEIAHQLGYASEAEANFIAYVIGVESKSPLFNYSAALQLFSYAQIAHLNSIAKRGDFTLFESTIARNKKLLDSKVIADRKAIRLFFEGKQDLQIPGSTAFYDQFLQWNKQANGVESYNDVLLWALAYQGKKNP